MTSSHKIVVHPEQTFESKSVRVTIVTTEASGATQMSGVNLGGGRVLMGKILTTTPTSGEMNEDRAAGEASEANSEIGPCWVG